MPPTRGSAPSTFSPRRSRNENANCTRVLSTQGPLRYARSRHFRLIIRRISNCQLTRKFALRHSFSVWHYVRRMAQISHLPEVTALVTMTHPEMLPTMNIGETIRNYRLQKGMSQGDIEKRTGLLRCYLSRVENGHTIPSLDTLSKIAGAMELPLSQFFSEPGHSNGSKGLPNSPTTKSASSARSAATRPV